MRLVLTGRNLDIPAPLRQQIARRLAKLERILNDAALSAQVVLSFERHRHLTDITLHARGDHVLHVVGAGTTWPLSVKDAVEKLALQAQRVKERWTSRKRRAPARRPAPVRAAAPPAVAPAPDVPPLDVPTAMRTRYLTRSLSLDEAAARLVETGEPFVLYRDRVTTRVTLVFRRKDGQVGFFEPQA
jgi:ribosomal subunit interface protein